MIPSEGSDGPLQNTCCESLFLLSISCVELNALVFASIRHASELCLKSCRLLAHSEKAVYRLSRTLRQQPSACTAATPNLLHARYCQTICRWQSVPPMSQKTMHSHQEILHSPRIDSKCGWSQKLAYIMLPIFLPMLMAKK